MHIRTIRDVLGARPVPSIAPGATVRDAVKVLSGNAERVYNLPV